MQFYLGLFLTASNLVNGVSAAVPTGPVGWAPPLPVGSPHPPPSYMKDSINNHVGTEAGKGSGSSPAQKSPNWTLLKGTGGSHAEGAWLSKGAASMDDYWLSSLGGDGKSPFAAAGYQVFRNVKDFGAVGDGMTDDTAAINRAVASYGLGDLDRLRCGAECGSTTTLGAVVYFPSGTYLISTPIVQYYYSQLVGHPKDLPVIKGSHNFTGIALLDTDVYVPGGNSAQWYLNQNNFYRQIRNFVFDMTGMNWTSYADGQVYVPAGIHWQVGQATSITNCQFKMAASTATQSATAVGIYMENGSGGFVSDLEFIGGNIGFLAASQQFTATNLQFTSCLTAIQHVWNWGFLWKNIYVLSCHIAIDCTTRSDNASRGTGSVTVLDSHFNGVPIGIKMASLGDEQPSIVLDNLLVENATSVVLVSGGDTILAGSTGAQYFSSWASGYQVLPGNIGGKTSGLIGPVPDKSAGLLDSSGRYFTQTKPQYYGENPVVATRNGVSNNGTGDQTSAINKLLAGHVGSVIFFPAGVYPVKGTVTVPVGSVIVGSAWSQILGSGPFFEDASRPQVMVRVGYIGDVGTVQISDMLFAVKGATAGCVLMEWNVHQSSQGSTAMWDSHFRVGGAAGSDLQLADCPASNKNESSHCMAASLMIHVTSKASGYFENIWALVADHDLDSPLNANASESVEGVPLNVQTDISVYGARGVLVESQGPTWFYGSSSEHSQMYQWQLSGARDVFLGHVQTESPYYQPQSNALSPYRPDPVLFGRDPLFADCADDSCRSAWALRVLNSSHVFIYSAGLYSFFQDHRLGCSASETCQLALLETNYAASLWMYNIFTKGSMQIVSPGGNIQPLLFDDTAKGRYTSEVSAWLALSGPDAASIGSSETPGDGSGSGIVWVDPAFWSSASASGSVTVGCYPPCTYVLPPLTLSANTTITLPPITQPIQVGWTYTTSYSFNGNTTTTVAYNSTIITTTITPPPFTGSIIPFWNINITGGQNDTTIIPTPSIGPFVITITDPPHPLGNGSTNPPNSRLFTIPPYPWPTTTLGSSSSASPSTSSNHSPTSNPTPFSNPSTTPSHSTLSSVTTPSSHSTPTNLPTSPNASSPTSTTGTPISSSLSSSTRVTTTGIPISSAPSSSTSTTATGTPISANPSSSTSATATGTPISSAPSSSTNTTTTTTPIVAVFPVYHTVGPAKPTCLIGCGSICEIFCGLPCLLDCDGGTMNMCDSNDLNCIHRGGGGGGGNDEATSCTTTTTTACSTLAVVGETTMSTCSQIVGCNTLKSSLISVASPPPYYIADWEPWKPNNDTNSGLLSAALSD